MMYLSIMCFIKELAALYNLYCIFGAGHIKLILLYPILKAEKSPLLKFQIALLSLWLSIYKTVAIFYWNLGLDVSGPTTGPINAFKKKLRQKISSFSLCFGKRKIQSPNARKEHFILEQLIKKKKNVTLHQIFFFFFLFARQEINFDCELQNWQPNYDWIPRQTILTGTQHLVLEYWIN